MVLLEELDITLQVGTNWLRETNGDGMKEIEIDGSVPLKFATDDRVVGPLDLDKISDALAPVFFGDF